MLDAVVVVLASGGVLSFTASAGSHKATLLEIADAWERVAEEVQREAAKNE